MRKTLVVFFLGLFAILCVVVVSCVRDANVAPADGQEFNPITWLNANYPNLKMLDLLGGQDPLTRSGIESESGMDIHRNPELNWDDASWHERDEYTVVEVPFSNQYNIMATWQLQSDDGNVIETVPTYMMLVIKCDKDNNVHAFVSTLIPTRDYLSRTDTKLWHHRHDVEGSNFSGYVVYSWVTGVMTDGVYFENGTDAGRLISPIYKQILLDYYGSNSCDCEEHDCEAECTENCTCCSDVASLTRSENDNGFSLDWGDNLIGSWFADFIDTGNATPSYMSTSEGGDGGFGWDEDIEPIEKIGQWPGGGFFQVCPLCHSPVCSGGCMRIKDPKEPVVPPGGGGGGGSPGSGNNGNGNNGNSNSPNLSNLFKTTMNQAQLQAFLKKMLENCSGSNLINKLLNAYPDGINLRIDPSYGTEGNFDYNSHTLTMSNFNETTMSHEMFHAFQSWSVMQNGDPWASHMLNHEIEAHIWEYIWVMNYGSKKDRRRFLGKGNYREIGRLGRILVNPYGNWNKYINPPAGFSDAYKGAGQFLQNAGYGNYPFNSNLGYTDAFKHISTLNSPC